MTEINLRFVPMGTQVVLDEEAAGQGGTVLQPREVWLDVGSRLGERCLDHHVSGAGVRSATELVTERFDELVARPLQGGTGAATLVLHENPDLDACAAAFYVTRRMEIGDTAVSARGWQEVVEQVSDHDQGFQVRPVEASLPVYFRGLTVLWQERLPGRDAPAEERTAAVARFVREGAFPLIEQFVRSAERGESVEERLRGMHRDPTLRKVQFLIKRARTAYEHDFRRARVFQMRLPMQPIELDLTAGERGHEEPAGIDDAPAPIPRRDRPAEWPWLDGIILPEPNSLLWKEFARTDRERSPQGHGFALSVVHRRRGGAGQHVISVDPEAGVCLTGLGGLLEAREKELETDPDRRRVDRSGEHRDRERVRTGRHGYGVDDPWYDGRGHEHTIIDNPACGSVLRDDEVNEVVWDYGHPARFIPVLGGKVALLFELTVDDPSPAALHRQLASQGWQVEALARADGEDALLTSAMTLFASGAPRDEDEVEDRAIHLLRDLEDPKGDGLLGQGALGGRVRAHLILFPDGLGMAALEYTAISEDGPTSLHEVATDLEGIRAELQRGLREGSSADGDRASRAVGLGTMPSARIRAGSQPSLLLQLQIDEQHAHLGRMQMPGVDAIFHCLCEGAPSTFEQLPTAAELETDQQFRSDDGRREAYLVGKNVAVYELQNAGGLVGRQERYDRDFQGLLLALALGRYQRRFLMGVNEQSAAVINLLPDSTGEKKAIELHRRLVEFQSRWRIDEISQYSFTQKVYEHLVERLSVRSLADSARDRLGQLVSRVQAENQSYQNRLIFVLTVLFFPISMAAGMFSGVHLDRAGDKQYFPIDLGLIPSAYTGWIAFGLWLAVFLILGFGIAIWMRRAGRIRRR